MFTVNQPFAYHLGTHFKHDGRPFHYEVFINNTASPFFSTLPYASRLAQLYPAVRIQWQKNHDI